MRTVYIALVMVVALLATSASMAQEKKRRAGAGKLSPVAQAMFRMHTLHKAMEGVELTEEQKAASKKLHEEIGPKMKEIMDGMKGILTEEQMTAIKTAGEKAKEEGLTGRKMFATVEAAAKLTDEQKEKLVKPGQELMALQRQVAKKLMAILTPEQKEKIKAAMAPQRKKKPAGAKKKAG